MLIWKDAPALDIHIKFFTKYASNNWFMNSGKDGSMTINVMDILYGQGLLRENPFQIFGRPCKYIPNSFPYLWNRLLKKLLSISYNFTLFQKCSWEIVTKFILKTRPISLHISLEHKLALGYLRRNHTFIWDAIIIRLKILFDCYRSYTYLHNFRSKFSNTVESLDKVDTIGAKKSVHFIEMSALKRFFLR